MKKEEILQKSREENQNHDEREEQIKLRSYAVSAAIGGLLCMIFVFLERVVFDRSTTLIWAIYSGMMFSKFMMDAVRLKKKMDLVLAILFGLCCVLNIVVYLLENIG